MPAPSASLPEIRLATESDVPDIVRLIHALAEYEKLLPECHATPERIREHLFGPHPYAEALVAETDGRIIGFALYLHHYSTFKARPSLYLEDLFVEPEFRSRGVGKALLTRIIEIARARACGRVEWMVIDWNTPAIDFYKGAFHAKPVDDWTLFRVDLDEAPAKQ